MMIVRPLDKRLEFSLRLKPRRSVFVRMYDAFARVLAAIGSAIGSLFQRKVVDITKEVKEFELKTIRREEREFYCGPTVGEEVRAFVRQAKDMLLDPHNLPPKIYKAATSDEGSRVLNRGMHTALFGNFAVMFEDDTTIGTKASTLVASTAIQKGLEYVTGMSMPKIVRISIVELVSRPEMKEFFSHSPLSTWIDEKFAPVGEAISRVGSKLRGKVIEIIGEDIDQGFKEIGQFGWTRGFAVGAYTAIGLNVARDKRKMLGPEALLVDKVVALTKSRMPVMMSVLVSQSPTAKVLRFVAGASSLGNGRTWHESREDIAVLGGQMVIHETAGSLWGWLFFASYYGGRAAMPYIKPRVERVANYVKELPEVKPVLKRIDGAGNWLAAKAMGLFSRMGAKFCYR